jgi:hypothetical protein
LIGTHTQHSCYGLATHKGEILVYQGFLGTNAFTKLRETLMHELAHLCVGLNNGHNKKFKIIERLFNSDTDHELTKLDEVKLKSVIPYKFRLIAHTENGTIADLGGVHRRSKRWIDYVYTDTRYDIYKGSKVINYEYIPYTFNIEKA